MLNRTPNTMQTLNARLLARGLINQEGQPNDDALRELALNPNFHLGIPEGAGPNVAQLNQLRDIVSNIQRLHLLEGEIARDLARCIRQTYGFTAQNIIDTVMNTNIEIGHSMYSKAHSYYPLTDWSTRYNRFAIDRLKYLEEEVNRLLDTQSALLRAIDWETSPQRVGRKATRTLISLSTAQNVLNVVGLLTHGSLLSVKAADPSMLSNATLSGTEFLSAITIPGAVFMSSSVILALSRIGISVKFARYLDRTRTRAAAQGSWQPIVASSAMALVVFTLPLESSAPAFVALTTGGLLCANAWIALRKISPPRQIQDPQNPTRHIRYSSGQICKRLLCFKEGKPGKSSTAWGTIILTLLSIICIAISAGFMQNVDDAFNATLPMETDWLLTIPPWCSAVLSAIPIGETIVDACRSNPTDQEDDVIEIEEIEENDNPNLHRENAENNNYHQRQSAATETTTPIIDDAFDASIGAAPDTTKGDDAVPTDTASMVRHTQRQHSGINSNTDEQRSLPASGLGEISGSDTQPTSSVAQRIEGTTKSKTVKTTHPTQ